MLARLDLAASKQCDGVEPDNVDAYANTAGFASNPITATDQVAFNRFIANEAHNRNLAVGLKNDLDQVSYLVDYFDFAVNGQCHQYQECNTLQSFTTAGKPVFNAEYLEEKALSASEMDQVCSDAKALNIITLFLSLELDNTYCQSTLIRKMNQRKIPYDATSSTT